MAVGIKVAFIGLKSWKRDMKSNARRLPSAIEKNTRKAAELVTRNAQLAVTGGERTRAAFVPKKGKRIRRKKPRGVSADKDQVGVFEGRLRQSLAPVEGKGYDLSRTRKLINAEVGSDVVYARRWMGDGSPFKKSRLSQVVSDSAEDVFRLLGLSFKVLR